MDDDDDGKTLAKHAEEWWQEQGKIVPSEDTPAWEAMYKEWINFAFEFWE